MACLTQYGTGAENEKAAPFEGGLREPVWLSNPDRVQTTVPVSLEGLRRLLHKTPKIRKLDCLTWFLT